MAWRRLLPLAAALLSGLLPGVARAASLYIAWDPDTASCKAHVTAFFQCILAETQFNQLVAQYPNGEPLTLQGTATLDDSCSQEDFQCIVDQTRFGMKAGDVLVHYVTGSNSGTGYNEQATVTTARGAVLIYPAVIEAGDDCNEQTCTGSHETFEAATDGLSADCCNGLPPSQCPSCNADCATYAGRACYQLVCDGVAYRAQYLGSSSAEFDASGCVQLNPPELTSTIGNLCTEASECCQTPVCPPGLACRSWTRTGNGPFEQACCTDVGGRCLSEYDCCGALACDPTSSTCICAPAGQRCVDHEDCCSGYCDQAAFVCKTPPSRGGCAIEGDERDNSPLAIWIAAAALTMARAVRSRHRRLASNGWRSHD
jgi:hypothetical protein